MNTSPASCDCLESFTRRRFLQTTLAGAAALSTGPLIAAPTANSKAETLSAQFYKTLTETQRAAVCFPFEHELRSRVDNNWHITKPTLANAFTPDQQAMVREIFRNLRSPEYADTVYQQVEHDSGKAGFNG